MVFDSPRADLEERLAELEGVIGRVSHQHLGKIRAIDFQRFAYAAGDLHGRYFGERSATAEAPPLFVASVMGWAAGPREEDLRLDGSDPAATAGLDLDGLSLMGAGQQLELHRPVLDGDELSMGLSMASAVLKEGQQGPFILLTLLRVFSDADDAPVLTCRETFVARTR